jgi:hypothetical protein
MKRDILTFYPIQNIFIGLRQGSLNTKKYVSNQLLEILRLFPPDQLCVILCIHLLLPRVKKDAKLAGTKGGYPLREFNLGPGGGINIWGFCVIEHGRR